MGIPKFFRWLTRRYPLILQNIKQEEDLPPIDNLYLDLNGIVHNCIHGNDAKRHERVSKLENFDEVWVNIMKAIDELVHSVKPKKILYMAVDGVAPRAKMNQQRARRFRSAKDSTQLKDQLESEGKIAPELFDSNAISPGTKFMHELSKQLEFFVKYKLNTDPLYQNLERVVLSDGTVPGEGEHKMMDFIRQSKSKEDYDPNTRHCFYGADADLIMLSLVTHEPHFIILREEHVIRKIKQGGVQRLDLQKTNNYQVIYVNLLREYLRLEYSTVAPSMKMKFDIERIIDDFVFFCFFIGNDFLPSLSALDISEGSLDSLIELYKKYLPEMDDYITNAGKIFWDKAEPFVRMLGEHEHESFKKRMHSIIHAYNEKIISFDAEFGQQKTVIDKAGLIKQKIQEKLREKKLKKILHMTQKHSMKHVKKFLLLKKFDDDDLADSLTDKQKNIRAKMMFKYKQRREKQRTDQNLQSESDLQQEDSKEVETLRDVISGIKEEYFSDVQAEDIDDDDVSSVSESEIDIENIAEGSSNMEIDNKIKIQQQIIDKYAEANIKFMTEFIKLYQTDPAGAKAMYYREKVHFDVNIPQGQAQKKQMLKKYIEGLQWVLYYYYKGAQHWRWYYPYHYAPMISDIDENIIQNYLSGSKTIEKFDIDENCSEVNHPYTPFQQLLSILPPKSKHLLPEQYHPIFFGDLKPFFPEDFDIDLNGRALPWEAATLIPFVDEKHMLEHEIGEISKKPLNEDDSYRNTITFRYRSYYFDREMKLNREKQNVLPLESPLKNLDNLQYDFVSSVIHSEYEDVGKYTFDTETIVVNEVPFEKILVKIPSCQAERSSEDLQVYINKFIKQVNKELFVDFPYQREAFPIVFENETHTFTVYGDPYTNIWKIHQDYQARDKEKYEMFCKRQEHKLIDAGYKVDEPKVFVSLNKVLSVDYDSSNNCFYKTYTEQNDLIPLRMIMDKRDARHNLNVNPRCASLFDAYQPNKEVVCLNMSLFGVIGTAKLVDKTREFIQIEFDKFNEESKIHDPFMGKKCLREDEEIVNKDSKRRYYSDKQIEGILKLKYGVVNKLTGSFLITFTEKETFKTQVYDLGLNVKNYTKKVHIPDFVRYVESADSIADNQADSYNHNQHARGANHVRKHWEYSQECFDIIKEYCTLFPEVIDCISRTMRQNRGMFALKDLYNKSVEAGEAQQKIKVITQWLEKLPVSQMPYVEMGFDALHEDLIMKINTHSTRIKEHYKKVELRCKNVEYFKPHMIFQEQFPYWTLPFQFNEVKDFKVGDRVMNVNSVRREYIPFGHRGTVVGKTNDKVIVIFDDQFLNGNNIYGHCQDFRGGFIDPSHLINLTKKFRSIQKKNAEIASSFEEQPLSEEAKAHYAEYLAQQEIQQQKQQQQFSQQQYQQQSKIQVQQNQQQQPRQQMSQQTQKQGQQSSGQNYQQNRNTNYNQNQPASQYQQRQQPQYKPKQQTQTVQIDTTKTTTSVIASSNIDANQQLQQLLGMTQQVVQTSVSVEETKGGDQVQTVQDEVVEEEYDDETQDPAIIDSQNSLLQNAEFQQLLDMMDLAKQMQNMNVFAASFVPGGNKPEEKKDQ